MTRSWMTRLLVTAAAVAVIAVQVPVRPAFAAPERPEPEVKAAPQHPMKPDDQFTVAGQAQKARAAATATGQAVLAPFLTRPYMNHHDVTSVFDHCNPNYTQDGSVCEEDGTTAIRANGTAPDLASGYATTPGGSNYLYYDGHDGWDMALSYEPLLAAADGTIYFAAYSNYGFGLTVIIDHPNGLSTRYGHMSRIDVTAGQHVYRGQQIGISGNTGNSTGPHLHFGVYRNDPWRAIDPWGWAAASPDPWPYQLGDLWIGGNPMNPVPTAPTGVTASAIGKYVTLSWSQPAFDGASPITSFQVSGNPGGLLTTVPGTQTSVTVGPLTMGTSYSFTVAATNQVGSGDTSAPSNSLTITDPPYESWFNWFDNVTPGMSSDNLHLVNPSLTSATTGFLLLGSARNAFSIAPGGEVIFTYPGATLGGPVHLIAGSTVLASQRVEYNQSFNESSALANARAGTDLYLDWYDLASVGMQADNIHVVNPGTSTTHVTVSGPGPALAADVPAAGEVYLSWPAGTIGGPVKIHAGSPVFASQRVQYNGSFNEVPARSATAASNTVAFNWYDHASPGMWNDNLHIVNPNGAAASVTVTVAGASQPVQVPAYGTAIASFPVGTIGGPVLVSSPAQPVLVSQRVQYYDSFNEALGTPVSAAAASTWMPWFDSASPGMLNDNIHVLNPDPAQVAHVTVTGPGTTKTFDVAPGTETWVTWPGAIGGPVHVVSSGAAVIASQRVQFGGSFNEAIGLPG